MSPKTTKFEHLLEAVPDALVGMDQEGVIRFVNRQTESLFGYERDQLIGQTVDTLVPENLGQIYSELRDNYFTDPSTRSLGLRVELTGRQQDGTEFPINISLSHIDTGDVLLVITAVGDVAIHQRAVQTAQLIAAIVEYSDDAIMGATLEGIITSWNPGAERLYGYSSEEALGRSGSLMLPEKRAGEIGAIMARIKEGQAVEKLEAERVRKDGTVVSVSITIAPIRDEDGAVVGASAVHRDISAQRQAFEAAQRMAAIVEGSDDAIISETLEGVIASWNPAATRMFGYASEEIIGKSAELMIPEDRAGETEAMVEQLNAGKHVVHCDTERVRKDGATIPVSLTVSPICDAEGTLAGASVLSRDMGELKHAADYARSLIEAGQDPLMTISPKGQIRDVNEAAVAATGVPRDQLIGTDFSSYFTDPDKAREGYLQAFEQGSVTDHPLTLRHRDGTLSDVLYNASVYRDSVGRVLGVVAAARDVTLQEKAAETAQRIQAIVESSDDAIVSGLLDGTITSWNPAAERMFGYSSEEIIGKSAEFLKPEGAADQMNAVVARIKAGQPVERLEGFRVRRDGTVFPVSLTVSPLWDEGALVGTSVIYRDMTEQVQVERALAQASRQYQLLAENASDLVVLASPDGVITWVSPSVTRTLGWATEDLMGTRMLDLVHPDDAAATVGPRDVEGSGHEATTPAGEFLSRIQAKSGQYRWMSGATTPVTDDSGPYVGVVSGLRDVDDLVRARQEAEVGRAALRATADSLLDPHVLLEAVRDETGQIVDFVYVDANPAACAYNGIDYEHLVGARLLDLMPGTATDGQLDQCAQVVDTGEPLVLDDIVYAQELLGGQERHYDVRAARVGDQLSYTWRDVTSRHEAAQWLAESEEHYRLLAENASDVVMRLSPDRRFEWVSGSIADVLGWAATDLLGQVIDEFIHPEELAAFRQAVAETSPESVASSEFRFRRSDRSYRWVLCHTRLKLDRKGLPVALVGGLVDIDTRKEVEAQEQDRLATLERFQRLTVGRELKMIELKREIENLRGLAHRDGDEDGDS